MLRFIGESHDQVSRCSGLSGRVTIRFEKLRFIGESHDQVRDTQVYRGESRSGLRRSGLSGRVTIRFEMLRFIGESHDQV